MSCPLVLYLFPFFVIRKFHWYFKKQIVPLKDILVFFFTSLPYKYMFRCVNDSYLPKMLESCISESHSKILTEVSCWKTTVETAGERRFYQGDLPAKIYSWLNIYLFSPKCNLSFFCECTLVKPSCKSIITNYERGTFKIYHIFVFGSFSMGVHGALLL